MVFAHIFTVTDEQTGERIDKFICANSEINSRSAVQKLLEGEQVTVDGRTVNKKNKIKYPDGKPLNKFSFASPL